MPELLIDLITSLDGYGAAEGWPGWWGLEGPEYLDWLATQPEANHTILMGATTYRLMSGFAADADASSTRSRLACHSRSAIATGAGGASTRTSRTSPESFHASWSSR